MYCVPVFSQGGKWRAIDPIPDAFIVNFGCAMEILTKNCPMPVTAVEHRVVQQGKRKNGRCDRFSYAMFVDSSLDENISSGLFRYEEKSGLILEFPFRQFLDKILVRTYRKDDEGLY